MEFNSAFTGHQQKATLVWGLLAVHLKITFAAQLLLQIPIRVSYTSGRQISLGFTEGPLEDNLHQ